MTKYVDRSCISSLFYADGKILALSVLLFICALAACIFVTGFSSIEQVLLLEPV